MSKEKIKNKKLAMLMLLEKYLKDNDKEKAIIIVRKLQELESNHYEELNKED